jgi:hypothetical protein
MRLGKIAGNAKQEIWTQMTSGLPARRIGRARRHGLSVSIRTGERIHDRHRLESGWRPCAAYRKKPTVEPPGSPLGCVEGKYHTGSFVPFTADVGGRSKIHLTIQSPSKVSCC